MNQTEAKHVFGSLMQKARKGTLTDSDKRKLNEARQALRGARKRNPAEKAKSKAKANPSNPTMIYGKILEVRAQKTQKHHCDAECKKAGHRYVHDFTSNAQIYGLPNGDVLITGRKR